nr:DUF6756 family protein [Flavobacterium gyeonganense]
MRKERNLLRKNWPDLRAEITAVIIQNKIPKEDFRPLSVNEDWKQIENNIIEAFCLYTPNKTPWLWNNFKLDTFSTSNFIDRPETYLDKLVEEKEKV